jgi:hypothetical protein
MSARVTKRCTAAARPRQRQLGGQRATARCAGWGGGGGEANCAINREFKGKGVGCHEAWPSSALRPGGAEKLQLEHSGAKLKAQ